MEESILVTKHMNTLFSQLASLSYKIDIPQTSWAYTSKLLYSYDQGLVTNLTNNVLIDYYLVLEEIVAAIL